MPTNKELSAQMATQFNATFNNVDDLKQWFEEKMDPPSLKGGSDPNQGIRIETISSSESSKSKTLSVTIPFLDKYLHQNISKNELLLTIQLLLEFQH